MKIKILFLSLLVGLWGCTDMEPITNFEPTLENVSNEIVEPEPDSVVVNGYELNRVFSKYGKVHARSYNVETIRDIQGNPAIYVMNYGENDGFVLVSAKKDCPPVLAYNNEGHFNINSGIIPVEDWVNENAEIVNHASDYIPLDSILLYRKLWTEFEKQSIHQSPISRYSGNLSSDQYSRLEKIYRDSMFLPSKKGFEIYGLGEYLRENPDKDYLLDIAMGVIYPEYQEDVLDLTFIGVRKGTYTFENNYVKAIWGQGPDYNISFPPVGNRNHALVGCVGIAVGQVMHSFQHPSKYNWAAMPNNQGNKTTSDFLYDLVKDAEPTYTESSTGVTGDNMYKMFTKNGYTAKYVSSNANFNCSIPFIVGTKMTDSDGKDHSHAWIVSGTSIIQYDDSMELWTFTQEYDFTVPYGETYGSNSSTSYYINWGYDGDNNGYYTNLNTAYPKVTFGNATLKNTKVECTISNIQPIK